MMDKVIEECNRLFHQRFDESARIDDTFAMISNTQGLIKGIEYLKSIGATRLDTDNYLLFYYINQLTLESVTSTKKKEIISLLNKERDFVKKAELKCDEVKKIPEIEIDTIDGIIKVIQFSSFVPGVKEVLPYIETEQRFGKCFDMAYHICLNLGIPNKIVTGYIYGYTDKSQFLHSWVEVTYKGEEWVIDGTINGMVNKDGYYRMKYVEPISVIPNEMLLSDLENYIEMMKGYPLEVYLTFRNEVINGLDDDLKKLLLRKE